MQTTVIITARVRLCDRALQRYSRDRDKFAKLTDLLADAMHWCDEHGEPFDYALAVAGKHYVNELNEEAAEERRLP